MALFIDNDHDDDPVMAKPCALLPPALPTQPPFRYYHFDALSHSTLNFEAGMIFSVGLTLHLGR